MLENYYFCICIYCAVPMKRLLSLLIASAIFLIVAEAKPLNGTLVRTSTADPCLIYQNGCFYLTMTGRSALAMIKDSSLANLSTKHHRTDENIFYRSKLDPTVKAIFGEDAEINGTWSPEIHYFSEEEFPGQSGWYLYFALRKKVVENGKVWSRVIKTVVMKSLSGEVGGPYGHPVTGAEQHSQPLLDRDGKLVGNWCVGASILRVPTGKYKGVYLTWVEETGRGEGLGKFYQKIMISRISSPWQLKGESGVVTTPTQKWEFKGSSKIHPRVVEGGTAVYGDHGEIYLTYSGSGYWSDYGIGQLTLRRNNGDYSNPLMTNSWVKYANNPIFTAVGSENLRGAGHATFLKDEKGKRFFCYHAFPFVDGKKVRMRNAYIEPYTISYTTITPTSPDGVLRMGKTKDGICAPTNAKIKFTHH